MKVYLLLSLLSIYCIQVLVLAQQKTCATGTEKPCTKGQQCVAPISDEPGAQGVCGKACNSGTKNACPKGQSCYTGENATPGAPGTCVSDALCYEEEDAINDLQAYIVDQIVLTYTTVLDSAYQNFMLQWLHAHPQSCGGASQVACTGNDTFCLLEPLNTAANASGHCYTGGEALGLCHIGTLNACGSGQECMAPAGTQPGGWGWCVADGSKSCVYPGGTCPSGTQCIALSIDNSSKSGSCMLDSECVPDLIELEELMWWQLENARKTFEDDIDAAHQAMVVAKISAILTSE